MYKLIIKDKEYLKQQPTMDEPQMKDYNFSYGHNQTEAYKKDLEKYKAHLASLKEYPVHPDYQGHWKEGQEVQEGEIKLFWDGSEWLIAPLQDVWDELRKLFRILEGSDNEDWAHNKTELKQRFTLTRKK